MFILFNYNDFNYILKLNKDENICKGEALKSEIVHIFVAKFHNTDFLKGHTKSACLNTYRFFSYEYRVATLFKANLIATGIIIQSLKLRG